MENFVEKQKIIILFIVLLVVITVGTFFWQTVKNRTQGPELQKNAFVTELPGPSFPTNPYIPNRITYSQSTFHTVPQTVGVYETRPELLNPQLQTQNVASILGFSDKPQTVDLYQNSYQLWDNGVATLTFGGKLGAFSYNKKNRQPSGAKNNNPQSLDQAARNQINSLGILPEPYVLDIPIVSHLLSQGNAMETVSVSPKQANIILFQYNVLLDGKNVVLANPNQYPFTLKYSESGELLSINGLLFPPLQTSRRETPVLSSQEIMQNLNSQKGSLLSVVSQEGIETTDVPTYRFKNVSVFSLKPAYFLDDNYFLHPIFIIIGQAASEVSQRILNTTTYLSALK